MLQESQQRGEDYCLSCQMIQQGTNCGLNVSNCTLRKEFPNKVMQIRNTLSGGAALSISGGFRAQAGKAGANLTGGGVSPTPIGTFQFLPSWSSFRQLFL